MFYASRGVENTAGSHIQVGPVAWRLHRCWDFSRDCRPFQRRIPCIPELVFCIWFGHFGRKRNGENSHNVTLEIAVTDVHKHSQLFLILTVYACTSLVDTQSGTGQEQFRTSTVAERVIDVRVVGLGLGLKQLLKQRLLCFLLG